MKQKIFSTVKVLLFLAAGIFLFYLVVKDVNFSDMVEKFRHANYWWTIPAVILGLASNISRAMRWNMLIHTLGYRPKTVNTFGGLMIGYMANLAIPRLGEFSRCGVVNRYEGPAFNKLMGTVFIERVIDVLTLFVLLGILLIFQFTLIKDFAYDNVYMPIHRSISSLLEKGSDFYLVVVAIVFVLLVILFLVYRYFRHHHLFGKFLGVVKGFIGGLRSIARLENVWMFVFHTVFIWLMYFAMTWVCFQSFGFTAGLGPTVVFAVLIFGSFGFAAPVQGGIGAYHILVTQTLVLYGLKHDDGLAYAFLSHSIQTLALIIIGGLAVISLPFINRRIKRHAATRNPAQQNS